MLTSPNTSSLTNSHTVHLCTMTQDQHEYDMVMRKWLLANGYQVLATSEDPLSKKIEAANSCDTCLLLLGPTFGPQDALSSFSHTELEAAAALDTLGKRKLFVIAQQDAISPPGSEPPIQAEQRDFIRRMSDFFVGSFFSVCDRPDTLNEILPSIFADRHISTPSDNLLMKQYMSSPLQREAVMISSTGAMAGERSVIRHILEKQGIPAIDYQQTPSQPVPPRTWVIESAQMCRAVLLILGPDYGFVSPIDGLSATELEFVTAVRANRPILAFIRNDAPTSDNHASGDSEQHQFVERVLRLIPSEQVYRFNNEDGLATSVHLGLQQLLTGRVSSAYPVLPEEVADRCYRRQVQRWLGRLPHLTQNTGMPLDQIFISLRTLPNASTSALKSNDEQDEQRAFVDESRDEQKEEAKAIEVDEALRLYSRLVLKGNPGSGKSAILRWYAINAKAGITPLFIRLSSYAFALREKSASNLLEFITAEEQRLVLSDGSLWRSAIESGRGLILLDALDEVPVSLQERVRDDILTLAEFVPLSTCIVVTTRIAGSIPTLAPVFTDTEVQPLDLFQQQQLVEHWLEVAYGNTQLKKAWDVAKQLLDLLQQETNIISWARTPLMLTLLTAIAYAADGDLEGFAVTKSNVFRHALRLMLGQWGSVNQRTGGRHLWLKERVLIEMAQQSTLIGRRQIWSIDDVLHVCKALSSQEHPLSFAQMLLSELSEEDGLLPQIGEQEVGKPIYTFYHPMMQEYLGAAWLAEQPTQRINLVVRHRLDAQWEETTELLVSELDRLGRAIDTDEIIRTLMKADAASIPQCKWSDPLHLTLLRAAYCQGVREKDQATGELGKQLAQQWGRLLFESLAYQKHHYYLQKIAGQAMAALGPAAIYAQPALQAAIVTRSDVQIFAIEALGQFKGAEIVDILREVLNQNTGDICKIAAYALARLGPAAEAARKDLYRIVAINMDKKEVSLAAAEALIAMGPTLNELGHIRQINDQGFILAIRAAASLIPAEAVSLLQEAFQTYMSIDKTYRADVRLEAIKAVSRLGDNAEPLIDKLVYLTQHDTERNQKAAENALLSLGPIAYPAMRKALLAVYDYTGDTKYRYAIDALTTEKTIVDPVQLDLIQVAISGLRNELRLLEEKNYFSQTEQEKQLSECESLVYDLDNARSSDQRGYLVRHIGPLGSQGACAVNVLRAIVRGDTKDNWDVRNDAVTTLGRIGQLAAPALEELRMALHIPQLRDAAVKAIGRLGPAAAPALPDLRTLLHDTNWKLQVWATEAIGQLGPAALPAIDDLIKIVRRRRSPLINVTRDNSSQYMVRKEAITALGALWPLSKRALADIRVSLLQDSNIRVRATAAEVLGQLRLDKEEVVPVLDALYKALQDNVNMHSADVANSIWQSLATLLGSIGDAGM